MLSKENALLKKAYEASDIHEACHILSGFYSIRDKRLKTVKDRLGLDIIEFYPIIETVEGSARYIEYRLAREQGITDTDWMTNLDSNSCYYASGLYLMLIMSFKIRLIKPFVTNLCRISQKFGWDGHSMYFCTVKNIKEYMMKQKFCQSCGMPLTEDVLGTNADGTKNEDYCMYCYKDGQFLQDCTMEEMIEPCAQFVNAVNEGLEKPITKEEYIGMMKSYFPQLKRWRQTLDVNNDEAMNANPALAGIKELIAQMADKQPIAYISSVDQEGFPWTKAMLKPRKREGIKTFYFTTNTFSIRVAQYKANPKASIYFCDAKGFKGMMLRGTMEVLTDAKSKEMIWHNGDEQYYPGGVTDPNYCVLKFTATDGRFYSDFYPRSFVIE